MARIEGLHGKQAPLMIRGLSRVAKRKWGRVSEMMEITAHVPKVALGWATFEMLFDRSTFVERKLRKLASTKVAKQLGCAA